MLLQQILEAKTLKKNPEGVRHFIEEFDANTHPHPFDRSIRIYGPVMIEIDDLWDEAIWIKLIKTYDEVQSGHASAALKFLIELADKYNVPLKLEPVPLGKGGLSRAKLIEWYKRYGFKGSSEMIRMPTIKENINLYARELEKKKIKVLGSGVSGTVYQHPTLGSVVSKVYRSEDTAYTSFLKFCKKHDSNPFLPRILEVHDLSSQHGFIIVFLEKLTKIKSSAQFAKHLQQCFVPDSVFEYEDDISDISSHSDPEDLKELFDRAMKSHDLQDDFVPIWKFLRTKYKLLDLHYFNCMLRGTQLVITDPLA